MAWLTPNAVLKTSSTTSSTTLIRSGSSRTVVAKTCWTQSNSHPNWANWTRSCPSQLMMTKEANHRGGLCRMLALASCPATTTRNKNGIQSLICGKLRTTCLKCPALIPSPIQRSHWWPQSLPRRNALTSLITLSILAPTLLRSSTPQGRNRWPDTRAWAEVEHTNKKWKGR